VDDVVELRISDNGCGIPEELRERVFEPFFTTKEVGQGTGQGLAMAHKTIVGKHHGELRLESTPGKGTTFIIRLPLKEPEDGKEAGASADIT
jgi:signal transduction histidine kinase